MRIYIRTFGCTLNQSDSEVMCGLLIKAGHQIVDDIDNSELVLFNTCTVKDNPEKRFFYELGKARKAGKKVVVAGCIPQAEPGNESLRGFSLIGVNDICSVAEVVERVAKGERVRFLKGTDKHRLNLPKKRKNKVVEIIPISAGCLGNCSYCKTRFARGSLKSYPTTSIKQQFRKAVEQNGVREVWLTSQDTGAYGMDTDSSLPELLEELLMIEGDYRVRLGMLNPIQALEFFNHLIRIYKHPKMFKFCHLPVQSGSNKVLALMNRKYKAQDFKYMVRRLRREIPGITISTDVICGFPGESEQDFKQTYDLVEELRIPVLNITKFSPRPGTKAALMKHIDTNLVKARSKALTELHTRISKNINKQEWLGWQGRIIIDEKGKDDSWIGRNNFYKPIVIKKNSGNQSLQLGETVKVRVYDFLESCLLAETIL